MFITCGPYKIEQLKSHYPFFASYMFRTSGFLPEIKANFGKEFPEFGRWGGNADSLNFSLIHKVMS